MRGVEWFLESGHLTGVRGRPGAVWEPKPHGLPWIQIMHSFQTVLENQHFPHSSHVIIFIAHLSQHYIAQPSNLEIMPSCGSFG